MPDAVRNIVKNAIGTPIAGATVTIDLVVIDQQGNETSIQGFHDDSDDTFNTPAVLTTNGSGIWSADLTGNDRIQDSSGQFDTTHWKITETANGISRSYYIKFDEAIPGTIWAGNYTDNNPSPSPGSNPTTVVLAAVERTYVIAATLTPASPAVTASIDASTALEVQFTCNVVTPASGGGNLVLQYSTNNTTWTTVTSVAVATSGFKTSGYLAMPVGARTVATWRIASNNGTGSSASISGVTMLYR